MRFIAPAVVAALALGGCSGGEVHDANVPRDASDEMRGDGFAPADAPALDTTPVDSSSADGIATDALDEHADSAVTDTGSSSSELVVFQCAGLAGGICTMNADGSDRRTLVATGRSPDRNAAGDILFHDDSYNVQLRRADGTTTSLGAGAFAQWTASGGVLFQCAGLAGGICTMNADGGARSTIGATGRSPHRNGTGDILFHDDSYDVQLRRADGTTTSLGAGAFARWTATGGVLFQCAGLAGGICTMNADGSSRQIVNASGRTPDRNDAGDILFHDDSYNVQLRRADGTITSLGPGAFARWSH